MMYGSALLPFREKVGVALSEQRSFQTMWFPDIANCASTPVELVCGDIVTQHDGEFDQKLPGGGRFRDRLRFLFREPFVETSQLDVGSGRDLAGQPEVVAKYRRTGLGYAPEPDTSGTGPLQWIETRERYDRLTDPLKAAYIPKSVDGDESCQVSHASLGPEQLDRLIRLGLCLQPLLQLGDPLAE